MTQAFAPISRETVSAQVRRQLLDRITSGALAPGSRLPSERDLSERFEVARTSVREAIQGLVSIGVVERRGNRTYVVEHLPDVAMATQVDTPSLLAELLETHRVLEVAVFEMATERATDDDRRRVAAAAAEMETAVGNGDVHRLNREFHMTVAAACANPLLVELYGKVLDRLFSSLDSLRPFLTASDERRIDTDTERAHREIASAFAEQDACAVRRAAGSHVDGVASSVVSAIRQRTETSASDVQHEPSPMRQKS